MSQWVKDLKEDDVKKDLALGFRHLRFSPSIEKVYEQYFYQWLSKRSRPVAWISLFIFLSYSVLDYHLFPEFVSQWTISIRLFFICPLIFMIIWLSYRSVKPRLFFSIYSLSYFLSGLALVAIIMSARLQQVYMPYDGLLLLLMYGYFVMKVPFFSVIAASWLVWLVYLAGGIYAEVAQQELIYNSFFLITANIIGGVGSYLQEHSQRVHFLGQLLLEFSHEKAERESEQKTKLIATASHELRQPLHAMNLLAENLSTTLNDTGQQQTMGQLQLSIKQLQDLLGSLFDISRLSVGVIKPRKKELDCEILASSLIQEYQPIYHSAGIELTVKSEASLLVYTDPILLTRILRNLLENALKHSQASMLSISLTRSETEHENYVIITVEDDGVGIAASEHSNAFKEFSSLARHSGGLGVGLAIVKQLTELLGMSICLTSSEDHGCRFTLILPVNIPLTEIGDALKSASNLNTITEIPFSTDENERTKRLMIIDDDLDVLRSMTRLLNGWGYEVFSYSLPEQALTSILDNTPDIVIVDFEYLNDESINGIQLIALLRQRLGDSIPALLLSANTELDLHALVDNDTIVAYKPLKPAKLKLIIRHLMASAKHPEENAVIEKN